MLIDPRAPAALAQVASLVQAVPVAMMTMRNANGTLDSRPMVPLALDATGALWFFTDLRAARQQHLRSLNLSFSDPARGSFVSLSGQGEVSTDRVRIRRRWTAAARRWFPDGPLAPNLTLLKVLPDAAVHWDMPSGAMVRVLGQGAGVGLATTAEAVGPTRQGTLSVMGALNGMG